MSHEDRALARVSFALALKWLEEIKALREPVPYGIARKWEATLSCDDDALDRLFECDDANWHGYAATMQEAKAVFAAKAKQEFVPKKGNAK